MPGLTRLSNVCLPQGAGGGLVPVQSHIKRQWTKPNTVSQKVPFRSATGRSSSIRHPARLHCVHNTLKTGRLPFNPELILLLIGAICPENSSQSLACSRPTLHQLQGATHLIYPPLHSCGGTF